MKEAIHTTQAPAAIGCYSQAIKVKETLYLSGQIALDPLTKTLVGDDVKAQLIQIFKNLQQVIEAAGLTLNAIVKLTVYLLDIDDLPLVNEVMMQYLTSPYPARTSVQVSALPKGAAVEIEGIAVF